MTEFFTLKVDKWTFRVPKDYYYIENDCWAKVEGDIATVGIADFLQQNMGDIIFVNFREVGSEISQFDECADFESTKSVLDVQSPVSGKIVEVNEKLKDDPSLANTDPYGEGWFLKIKLTNFEFDKESLLNGEQYFEVFKKKIEIERKRRAEKEAAQKR